MDRFLGDLCEAAGTGMSTAVNVSKVIVTSPASLTDDGQEDEEEVDNDKSVGLFSFQDDLDVENDPESAKEKDSFAQWKSDIKKLDA